MHDPRRPGTPSRPPRRPSPLKTYVSAKFPRYWVPDAFVRVETIPKTSVGKLNKMTMRTRQKLKVTQSVAE